MDVLFGFPFLTPSFIVHGIGYHYPRTGYRVMRYQEGKEKERNGGETEGFVDYVVLYDTPSIVML